LDTENSAALAVTVVIPHLAGEFVAGCLEAISTCDDLPSEIIVVDDGSSDGSTERAEKRFPDIRVVRNERNLGFPGACNRGLTSATFPIIVLLNDDTTVQPGWLAAIVKQLDQHPQAGAVQPKILSAHSPGRFDYAGGAGGLMDRFGYPFALGRLFDHLEEDQGQYDEPQEIFWASGTAIGLRREALDEVGLLDETFEMHMEEIDLCWRMWLAGWTVRSAPDGRVTHFAGGTLAMGSYRKMALNHRNGLIMLLKNHSLPTLLWMMPFRLILESLTVVHSLIRGDLKRALAAATAPFKAARRLPHIIATRRGLIRRRAGRTLPLYRGSVALRWAFGFRDIPSQKAAR
jgi:hypothetical protein